MGEFKGDTMVGDISTRSGKAVRSQKFFYRKVGKLHDSGTTAANDSKQTRASRQHSLFMVFPPPIWVHLRGPSLGRIKVIRKQFSELLDTERPNGHCETLQETMGVVPTWFLNFPQYALVRLIQ